MIRYKTKKEIELIREGGRKLAAILDFLVKMAKPGITTGDLENKAVELIGKAGGRPAFKDVAMSATEVFPTALCTSINEEIVHAPAVPPRVLNEGDIIGIDIGMEYPFHGVPQSISSSPGRPVNKFSPGGGYYTDMAVTVGIGEIGEEVKKLLTVTKECLEIGIKQVKPGGTLIGIGTAIQEYAERRGYGVVRELVGHGVGHDYHEEPQVPNYKTEDKRLGNIVLKPGLVLAIEPMVNIGGWKVKTKEDGMTIVTADGSLSAHFEHTVVVTESGVEVLTRI